MSIWDCFRPFIEYLEAQDRSPGVAPREPPLRAQRLHGAAKMPTCSKQGSSEHDRCLGCVHKIR